MFDLRKSIRIAMLPIIGLTVLEAFWNIIGRIYILYLLSPILYLVKFSIYGYCGYIAYTQHDSDLVEGATTGAMAGFIFALIEGLLVSPLFTGTLFYHWGSGLPIGAGISTIVTQVLFGVIFSAIGVYITPRYLIHILRSRGIGSQTHEREVKVKGGPDLQSRTQDGQDYEPGLSKDYPEEYTHPSDMTPTHREVRWKSYVEKLGNRFGNRFKEEFIDIFKEHAVLGTGIRDLENYIEHALKNPDMSINDRLTYGPGKSLSKAMRIQLNALIENPSDAMELKNWVDHHSSQEFDKAFKRDPGSIISE